MVLSVFIISISICLQLVAGILAYRLTRTIGWKSAWSFIALALFLMGLRRSISLIQLIQSESPVGSHIPELVALTISVIMVVGIIRLGSLFRSSLESQLKLKKSEEDFRELFEHSEVSIWQEDFSGVYSGLEELREKGVDDIRRYLGENPDVVLALVKKVKVLKVNSASVTLFGANSAATLIHSVSSTFGKNAMDVFINELCAIWNKESYFRSEAEFKRLDGSSLTCLLSMPIPSSQVGFSSIPVSMLDISERKSIENDLRSNSERFERWKASNFIGILQFDANGGVSDANDALLEMIGYSRQELLEGALNWETLTPTEFLPKDLAAMEEASVKGFWTPFEKEYVHKDGHQVPIIIGGSLFKDAPNEYIVFIIDLSEQKKVSREKDVLFEMLESKNTELKRAYDKALTKEKELQDTLNFMCDPVITIDQNGVIASFNPAAETMFAYMESEVLGKNIGILMPDAIAREHDGYLQQYADTGESKMIGIGREVEGLRKNRQRFQLRLSVTELPIGENGKRRFIGSCVDLTELKKQEERNHRSQKMDALGNLTSGIAHDFNNILGIVQGYAGLLEDGLDGQSELLGFARQINYASDRGAKLTQKLLGFSRKKTPNATNVDVNQVLQGLKGVLEKSLTVRIRLSLDLDESICPVCLDQSELEDAVLNMSINAMHAMDGQGELTLKTQECSLDEASARALQLQAGNYVLLSLTDNGCGMDDETREKVFEPFFSTKGNDGTGLGLSQVYGFVTSSQGVIKAYSKVGHGTCLSLYFPCCLDTKKEKTEKVRVANSYRGTARILLVDDEPAIRHSVKMLLSRKGYSVITAECAKEALNILSKQSVDVLLSDIIMPDMDGYELTTIVRERYPSIKIQLASGYADERHAGKADESLIQNMLNKPYRSAQLYERIWRLLNT